MRCSWAKETEPIYVKYHDEEWGRPLYDNQKLFELLCLEGAQAGLSWLTILKRRENYRRAFDNFDAVKMARYDEEKINELFKDEGIIRNKRKVIAFIENAKAYLRIVEQYGSFSDYIWQFVGSMPIQNSFQSVSELPASTSLSEKMSKQLKKDGFRYVGPTICYAFMQAAGLVNDHIITCPCYEEVKKLSLDCR